jgi:hypothetical protein
MAELKHTPTPWRQMKQNAAYIEQGDANDLHGLIVADCHMTDESAANAAFIVRATNSYDDLLSALEAALEALDEHAINFKPAGYGGRTARVVVREAIAKASAH